MPPFSGPPPVPVWPRFHAAVLAHQQLLDRLCAASDLPAFRHEVFAIATELGLALSEDSLDAALSSAREEWLLRRLVS